MENEKKGIKCSYAVLVIILFAALAFVVDYAVIERKMNKCNCPDCSATNTNVVTDDSTKTYSYADLAGHYKVEFMDLVDEFGNNIDSIYNLYLYSDGTFYYTHLLNSSLGQIGTYTIDGNNIVLNTFFSHGGDIGTGVSFTVNNISFNNNYEISVKSPDGIEKQDVILPRIEKYDESNNDDSLVKQRLESTPIYNKYNGSRHE
jgi:hypothetical protein